MSLPERRNDWPEMTDAGYPRGTIGKNPPGWLTRSLGEQGGAVKVFFKGETRSVYSCVGMFL